MDTAFGLYVCQKSTYKPDIQHAICPGTGLQHIVRFFENVENFGFWKKSYIKISVFNFGVPTQKTFLRKIRDSSLKELLILRHLVLLFAFYF